MSDTLLFQIFAIIFISVGRLIRATGWEKVYWVGKSVLLNQKSFNAKMTIYIMSSPLVTLGLGASARFFLHFHLSVVSAEGT